VGVQFGQRRVSATNALRAVSPDSPQPCSWRGAGTHGHRASVAGVTRHTTPALPGSSRWLAQYLPTVSEARADRVELSVCAARPGEPAGNCVDFAITSRSKRLTHHGIVASASMIWVSITRRWRINDWGQLSRGTTTLCTRLTPSSLTSTISPVSPLVKVTGWPSLSAWRSRLVCSLLLPNSAGRTVHCLQSVIGTRRPIRVSFTHRT
jgi:hypothetical protein